MPAGHIQATSGTNDASTATGSKLLTSISTMAAALVDGSEPGGARGEGVVDVVDRDGLRADGDGARQHVAIENDVAQAELEVEVAEELQGIDPGLEDAVFAAEQPGVGTDGVEKLPVARGAGEGHAAGVAAIRLGEQRRSKREAEGDGHEKRSEAHRFAMLEESGSRGKWRPVKVPSDRGSARMTQMELGRRAEAAAERESR